ncbi:hypothetical protein EV714DRAFT_239178 [Schizophyllum commune]
MAFTKKHLPVMSLLCGHGEWGLPARPRAARRPAQGPGAATQRPQNAKLCAEEGLGAISANRDGATRITHRRRGRVRLLRSWCYDQACIESGDTVEGADRRAGRAVMALTEYRGCRVRALQWLMLRPN